MRYLLLFLLTLSSIALPLQADPNRPNIVLIFTDDQGYADVGCFGSKSIPTPHLDQLAKDGRKFTDFHVAQAVCSASRAALLTGCYPNRIGFSGALGPRSKIGLNPNETTIARLLKQKGYATGMAGKWHLGDHPNFLPTQHGFDEYLGVPYSNDMWPHHPEAKSGAYPPLPLYENNSPLKSGLTGEDQALLTGQYAERAVQFIEKNKDRPFFFYLAPNMPHVPLFVSDRFKGKSGAGLYADVIMEIDDAVGQVLAALKRNGLEHNTLVIFTSDNGPWLSYGNHAGSATPLREGKGTSFEGGTRVPCIMRWPARIPANSTCTEPLMTIDILPTIAAITDAPLPNHRIDGQSILPFLTADPAAKNPHPAYFTYYNHNDLQAVRAGRWKLVLNHRSRTMQDQPQGANGKPGKYRMQSVPQALYDLQSDLSESIDVAKQNPHIVADLERLAEIARADLGDDLTRRTPSGTRPVGRVD
jgi:arylsulfatase A